MKVGILTFQYALNHGAVLQMYALTKTVKSLGYDVEIIDYIPNGFSYKNLKANLRNSGLNKNSLFKINLWPIIFKKLLNIIINQNSLINGFKKFLNNNFKLSFKLNDENWEEIAGNYDFIIVGSDQVWNPSNQTGKVYFLNSNLKCKKISYAADSTNNVVNKENKARLKSALNDFSIISVRNLHTQEFVEKVIGKKPIIVPDPVILNDFSMILKQNIEKDKYALIYILGDEIKGGHDAVIQAIKEKYENIKIVQIVMINQFEYSVIKCADEKFFACSPDQWINLIYNAEFIYTDSFHATIFSIKFHKNFLCYYVDPNRAPRLISLQKQYNLGSKIVSSFDEVINSGSFDIELNYSKIDVQLSLEKNEGINFLITSLEGNQSYYEN